MQKELNIEIPEGYEIDKEKSTFEKIIFKKKTNKYPMTWEEFCKKEPNTKSVYFIDADSKVLQIDDIIHVRNDMDQNLCKTKEEAEAFLTLIQMKRLWHEYVDDSKESCFDYGIMLYPTWDGIAWSVDETDEFRIFSFPNRELAQKFLNNFNELFIKIEPLFHN